MSEVLGENHIGEEDVSDKILTIPNIISFIRLLLVPVYFIFLFEGQTIWALVTFCIAAASDCIDGQVARRTHSVSKLGKILDPSIDTILMFSGVLGLVLIGSIPSWIMILILVRELYLLVGGMIMMIQFEAPLPPVIYPGKTATTLLFIGFAGMMLGLPEVGGLGVFDTPLLPGFNAEPCAIWIWLIYIGLVLQIIVTIYYTRVAWQNIHDKRMSAVSGKDAS